MDRYPAEHLEVAYKKALSYTASPSYKSIKNILTAEKEKLDAQIKEERVDDWCHQNGISKANYYRLRKVREAYL